MVDLSQSKEPAPGGSADGTHIGTVDHVEAHRLKLTKTDSPDGKHHYVSIGLVAEVEDGTVRLSAGTEAALLLEDDA